MAHILRKIAYLFIVLCLFSVVVSPAYADEGDGFFTLTVLKGEADPLAGVNCYVFSENGSYLGLYETTNSEGQVSCELTIGDYKFRVDYLGYQFWTDVYNIPATLSEILTIPHQNAVITVQGVYQGTPEPKEGVPGLSFHPVRFLPCPKPGDRCRRPGHIFPARALLQGACRLSWHAVLVFGVHVAGYHCEHTHGRGRDHCYLE